ncbi:MAG: hypothetical protein C4315_11200 [Chloroflexota bacterium]
MGQAVAGVRFERAGRVYFVEAQGLQLRVGDLVLVEVEGTTRVGRVVIAPAQVVATELAGPQGRVLGKVQ